MLSLFDVTIASRQLQRLAMLIAAAAVAAPLWAQSPPRAPDGHPDLQGTWNFSSLTPLERPAQFADKPVLTDAEAAEFERQTLERIDADRRRDTAEAEVAQAYNNAWYRPWDESRRDEALVVDHRSARRPDSIADRVGQGGGRRSRRGATRAGAGGRPRGSLPRRALPPVQRRTAMLPGPYNNNLQIIQTRDYVVIANEMIHDVRIVPLDGRPHLPAAIRRWQGDLARPLGRRHARRRHDQLQRSDQRSAARTRNCTWSSGSRGVDAKTLDYRIHGRRSRACSRSHGRRRFR